MYFEKGGYKSVKLEFKNAAQIDPKDVDAYQNLGETNLKLGDAQKAFRAYSSVSELEPDNIEAQLKLATFLMLAKKHEDSRKKVKLVLRREPDNIQVMQALARHYVNQGNVDEAEKQIAKILQKRSNYFPAHMLKGELLVKNRQFDAALSLFDPLIVEEPGSARALYFKGLSHFGMGDINLFATTLASAVELDPAFVNARLLLTEIYLRKHDFAMVQEQAL